MLERLGHGVIVLLLGVAIFGPLLPLADPLATNARAVLLPPQAAHPFGTDALGRDMLARVVHAARLDLGLAIAAVLLAMTTGTLMGAVVGWVGGLSDRMAGWIVDVLMALPIYLLAMVLAAALGNGLGIVVLATALINLPFYIRLARLEVRRLRRAPWLEGARMGGAADGTLLRLVLPAIAPLVSVQATTNLGWAMLNAAGLSFIGIGVRPPVPEWGVLIAEGSRHLAAGQWWLVLAPGAALVLAVLGFHLAGDGLRSRFAAGRSA